MKYKIPNQNNLYGTIFSVDSKKFLAEKLEAVGWNIRKSSWTDYEARIEWGELAIEGDKENTLISGVIDPTMFNDLEQLCCSLKIKYSLELYNDEGILIREQKSSE
jgi:hypothetical protein